MQRKKLQLNEAFEQPPFPLLNQNKTFYKNKSIFLQDIGKKIFNSPFD